MELIPTRNRRTKLPKQLSYPTNAKMISDALAEVPQLSLFSISFLEIYLSRKLRHEDKEYIILSIQYIYSKPNVYSSENLIQQGHYEPKWEIVVHSVPREYRHLVATQLETEFFIAAKKWLLERKDIYGLEGCQRIQFFFNEVDQTTRIEEYTHS
jgi:hypothetical protein